MLPNAELDSASIRARNGVNDGVDGICVFIGVGPPEISRNMHDSGSRCRAEVPNRGVPDRRHLVENLRVVDRLMPRTVIFEPRCGARLLPVLYSRL